MNIKTLVKVGFTFSALLVAACNGAASRQPVEPVQLIIGTYSNNGSKGIYGVSYDAAADSFSAPALLAEAENPSFLAITKDKVYAVNETGNGSVSTFAKTSGTDGLELRLEHKIGTNGASPCYVSTSPDNTALATANYMGGNVSVFGLDKQLPKGPPVVMQHLGSGPNQQRQEAPHAHWVGWHPSLPYVYAVDLGIDEVKAYTADNYVEKTALQLQPGDGPRHLVFHPELPRAYVLNELSNTLVTARVNKDGTLAAIARHSTLPESFAEHSQAAHIAISSDGSTLYVSNRGHNSIAVFAVDKKGDISLIQHQSTEGDWPRHFALLERHNVLIVANKNSGDLVAFDVDEQGRLSSGGGSVKVAQPTFVGPAD